MLIFQRLAEEVFVVLSLLAFTGGLLPHVPGEGPLYHLLTEVLPYVGNAVTILLIAVRWRTVVPIVIREKLLWVLMAIALASVLWSAAPELTLGHLMPLLRVTLFGVYFGTCYSLNEQLRLLAWALGIAALFSLVVGAAFPKYGVMGMGNMLTTEDAAHAGSWRGIFVHKTLLGTIMALSGLVFILFASSSRRYCWIAWLGFGLSVALIVLSTTKAALVIFITILALLPLYRALRWNYTLAVPFFSAVVFLSGGLATYLLSNAESLLGILGRDITISGRTDIWPAVIDKLWERPWLGYGYNAFWLGWEGESADVWHAIRQIHPTHAHNGFLDLGIDLGLLGLSIFALCTLICCLRAIKGIRITNTDAALFPLAYLTFMVLFNLTESSLMREDIYWLLYVAVILSVHNENLTLVEDKAFWQHKAKGGAM